MSRRTFSLSKECEVRFEVNPGWTVQVTLTSGSAELFGVPLIPQEVYQLSVGRFAISTWQHAEIILEEVRDKEFVSNEAEVTTTTTTLDSAYATDDASSSLTLVSAVNVHGRLERERELAQMSGQRGPVVMLCGPTDSGKSTFARILLAYGVRRARRPMFVDLDPGQNDIAPPGSVAAVTVDSETISVEEGVSSGGALVYFYGHSSPGESVDGFKRVVEQLAVAVEARFGVDPASCASGMVINTCGWVEGLGYRLLLHAATTFRVGVVLVMGQDRLLADLKRDLKDVNVLKIPVSGGATVRSKQYRKLSRDSKIREYFYGPQTATSPGGDLSPQVVTVGFDDVELFRGPTKEDASDESMRPVGKATLLDPNRARVVPPTVALQHSLVAVSHATNSSDILTKNVAGFVHVQSVDVEHRKISLLCPQGGGSLPNNLLLVGGQSVKWMDEA